VELELQRKEEIVVPVREVVPRDAFVPGKEVHHSGGTEVQSEGDPEPVGEMVGELKSALIAESWQPLWGERVPFGTVNRPEVDGCYQLRLRGDPEVEPLEWVVLLLRPCFHRSGADQ